VWRQPRPGQVTTDLGTVSAKEAASYLVGLVRRSQSSVARDAILPATLADSAIIWPDLAAIAKDVGRPTDVRKQAVFWLGQAAADVTGSLDSLASNDEAGREVREQAVFALSQRPKEEGVPMLIKIAQTNHDPEVRRKALFWLGQSDDPRAIALFEAILLDARR
jgi:HEAT repeat protein